MYRDRIDAANRLLEECATLELVRPLVLAIPRGGVIIGDRLARGLDAELDVVLARKLRAPAQRELALGAVAEDGAVSIDESIRRRLGVPEAYLQRETRDRLAELARIRRRYRAVRPAVPIDGRTVIVTDDGVATGATMNAALRVIAAHHPGAVVVAVPVSSPEQLPEIGRRADRVICPMSPSLFHSVGQFYGEFPAVPEGRVLEILAAHAARRSDRDAPAGGAVPRGG